MTCNASPEIAALRRENELLKKEIAELTEAISLYEKTSREISTERTVKQITAYFRLNPNASAPQASQATGIPAGTVKHHRRLLVQAGVLPAKLPRVNKWRPNAKPRKKTK
jgi:hypothetical protein